MFFGGKAARFYLIVVFRNGFSYNLAELGILLGVLGDKVGKRTENIINHLNLTIAADTGADADGGHAYFLGNQCSRLALREVYLK